MFGKLRYTSLSLFTGLQLALFASLLSITAQAAPGLTERPDNTSCLAPGRPGNGDAAIRAVGVYDNVKIRDGLQLLKSPDRPDRWLVVQSSGKVLSFAFERVHGCDDAHAIEFGEPTKAKAAHAAATTDQGEVHPL